MGEEIERVLIEKQAELAAATDSEYSGAGAQPAPMDQSRSTA
jgi:hypothetical protein